MTAFKDDETLAVKGNRIPVPGVKGNRIPVPYTSVLNIHIFRLQGFFSDILN